MQSLTPAIHLPREESNRYPGKKCGVHLVSFMNLKTHFINLLGDKWKFNHGLSVKGLCARQSTLWIAFWISNMTAQIKAYTHNEYFNLIMHPTNNITNGSYSDPGKWFVCNNYRQEENSIRISPVDLNSC